MMKIDRHMSDNKNRQSDILIQNNDVSVDSNH